MGVTVCLCSEAIGLFFVICAATCPPWQQGLKRNLLLTGSACFIGGLIFFAIASALD